MQPYTTCQSTLTQPVPNLRIVAISDTHGELYKLKKLQQTPGDIFIHGGDFTEYGRQ